MTNALAIAGTAVATVALYCTALWFSEKGRPFFSACCKGAAFAIGALSWLLLFYGLRN
jgi:hypothetical protein